MMRRFHRSVLHNNSNLVVEALIGVAGRSEAALAVAVDVQVTGAYTDTDTDIHKHINTHTPPAVLQCAAGLEAEECEKHSLGCAADLIDMSVCV